MERVTFEEYEAAKAEVLYGKEYEETSSMENNVIHKQYVCKDGTLFHKGDFEAQLDKTKEVLKAAGVYINSIDAESYETETGYWLVPITVEILKEE